MKTWLMRDERPLHILRLNLVTTISISPGDVVVAEFPGVNETKRRPALVLSTDTYHANRPDVILGVITSQLRKLNKETDFVLKDWKKAGLRKESAFRSFLVTLPERDIRKIGALEPDDWRQVQGVVKNSIEVV